MSPRQAHVLDQSSCHEHESVLPYDSLFYSQILKMASEYPADKKSSSNYIFDDEAPPNPYDSDAKSQPFDPKAKNEVPPSEQPPAYDADASETTHLQGHLTFNLNAPWYSFHIYRDSMFNHDMTIMTPDKASVAYSVRIKSVSPFAAGPHIFVYRCPSKYQSQTDPVGTVTLNRNHTIDFSFHGRPPVTMAQQSHQGLLGNLFLHTHAYLSPAPGVGALVWGRADQDCTYLRTASGDREVARLDGRKSIDKRGVLRVAEGGLGDPWIDEVVTTAVTYDLYSKSRR